MQVDEEHLVARVGLRGAVDETDTSSHFLPTGVVLHQDSWLQSSGFPRKVQNTIKDLIFEKNKLFPQQDGQIPSLVKGLQGHVADLQDTYTNPTT